MQYIKLQVAFGGDIHEVREQNFFPGTFIYQCLIIEHKVLVLYQGEPIVADLMVAIEQNLSVPAETQRIMFKGQSLHEFRDAPLRNFGICNESKLTLVGRKVFIK